ncbi:hypothetical protein DSO57_1013418 [Entomophthora muscae]|uniref:Uncharacterized protein n=1 Tax=Entomophthora muscae TaxID=34485 RepID=A0ACC2TSN8_9FUNG|nr:hypothetical protein DSO57_1013418 [Entomophthora muscae]
MMLWQLVFLLGILQAAPVPHHRGRDYLPYFKSLRYNRPERQPVDTRRRSYHESREKDPRKGSEWKGDEAESEMDDPRKGSKWKGDAADGTNEAENDDPRKGSKWEGVTAAGTTAEEAESESNASNAGPMDLNLMLRLVNSVRARVGARPLRLNGRLIAAAQKHSQYQARIRRMTHNGSGGSSPSQRIEREGYDWANVGENVAWNQRDVRRVMTAWVNSPQHYKNLISRDFTEFGAGVYNLYWTQDFGSRF